MPSQHLQTYLRDHLAGAVAALELIEHVQRTHAGTSAAAVVARVGPEIEEDRRELESIIAHVGATEGSARKAVAWFGERVARLKLHLDDPADGDLRLLESLDILSLGIEGKGGLWRALAAAAPSEAALRGPDYDLLIARAVEQRRAVELERTPAAARAFAP